MLNLVVFETEEELCELTGLTEDELGKKVLILMIGRLVFNPKLNCIRHQQKKNREWIS